MKQRIAYELVAYDPASGALVYEKDIPERLVAKARATARVPQSDPHMAGTYAVTERDAFELADAIGGHVPAPRLHYYIEPHATSDALAR